MRLTRYRRPRSNRGHPARRRARRSHAFRRRRPRCLPPHQGPQARGGLPRSRCPRQRRRTVSGRPRRCPRLLLTRTTSRALLRLIRYVATGGSSVDPVCSGGLDERFRTSEFDDDDVPALRGLTPQERRLLDHLAEGLTNPQIAERMNLAEKTVKNYVSNLLRKLNAGSRTEAAGVRHQPVGRWATSSRTRRWCHQSRVGRHRPVR